MSLACYVYHYNGFNLFHDYHFFSGTRGLQYGEIFVLGGLGTSLEPCSKFERFLVNEMKWETLPDVRSINIILPLQK